MRPGTTIAIAALLGAILLANLIVFFRIN